MDPGVAKDLEIQYKRIVTALASNGRVSQARTLEINEDQFQTAIYDAKLALGMEKSSSDVNDHEIDYFFKASKSIIAEIENICASITYVENDFTKRIYNLRDDYFSQAKQELDAFKTEENTLLAAHMKIMTDVQGKIDVLNQSYESTLNDEMTAISSVTNQIQGEYQLVNAKYLGMKTNLEQQLAILDTQNNLLAEEVARIDNESKARIAQITTLSQGTIDQIKGNQQTTTHRYEIDNLRLSQKAEEIVNKHTREADALKARLSEYDDAFSKKSEAQVKALEKDLADQLAAIDTAQRDELVQSTRGHDSRRAQNQTIIESMKLEFEQLKEQVSNSNSEFAAKMKVARMKAEHTIMQKNKDYDALINSNNSMFELKRVQYGNDLKEKLKPQRQMLADIQQRLDQVMSGFDKQKKKLEREIVKMLAANNLVRAQFGAPPLLMRTQYDVVSIEPDPVVSSRTVTSLDRMHDIFAEAEVDYKSGLAEIERAREYIHTPPSGDDRGVKLVIEDEIHLLRIKLENAEKQLHTQCTRANTKIDEHVSGLIEQVQKQNKTIQQLKGELQLIKVPHQQEELLVQMQHNHQQAVSKLQDAIATTQREFNGVELSRLDKMQGQADHRQTSITAIHTATQAQLDALAALYKAHHNQEIDAIRGLNEWTELRLELAKVDPNQTDAGPQSRAKTVLASRSPLLPPLKIS